MSDEAGGIKKKKDLQRSIYDPPSPSGSEQTIHSNMGVEWLRKTLIARKQFPDLDLD
jgi:hypothetical protein